MCDPGSPVNIIPYTLYAKNYEELSRHTLEPTDVVIKLVDKTDRIPWGVLKDVNIIIGSLIYPIGIYVLMISQDQDYPIVFGTSFMNVAGAYIKMKIICMNGGMR